MVLWVGIALTFALTLLEQLLDQPFDLAVALLRLGNDLVLFFKQLQHVRVLLLDFDQPFPATPELTAQPGQDCQNNGCGLQETLNVNSRIVMFQYTRPLLVSAILLGFQKDQGRFLDR